MARGVRSTLTVKQLVEQPVAGKAGQARWGKAMRATFLDHLAATCNVAQSAAATGVFPATVYAARRRDASFAAQWNDALALGYQMLETRLIGHVLAGRGRLEKVGDEEAEEAGAKANDADSGGVDFEAGLRLLTAHRNATGKPHKGGSGRRLAAPDDTDKLLLKRLAQIEARRARAVGWANAAANAADVLAIADTRPDARNAIIEQVAK